MWESSVSEINFGAKKLGDLDPAKYSIIHPNKIFGGRRPRRGPYLWAFTVFKEDTTPKLFYEIQDIAGITP